MKFAVIAVFLFGLPFTLPGQSCPMGISNDPHPGHCGAYRDADSDSICDLSQPAAAAGSDPALPPYHAWQIFLAVILLAAATELLISRKKDLAFRLQTAWNWLLLLAFLLSSLTGLYFVLPLSWRPAAGIDLSYWHAETGLAFIAVGAYHALRRFACMLRGLGACFRRR
jgi:hypothetical protein